ncbi:MAG: glycosyltransferase [Sphingomonas sp.]|uniref:glycosyltransferase family 4 protein n=1 Tax=Sphingomonas sp. TaxID=28214 RepID=UPI0017DA17A7|nr:glycosyltransferase family 4 protein [Sphingomonas sp.]MBA3666705.1 glycosyltransferase [Sphingomonas sp.]
MFDINQLIETNDRDSPPASRRSPVAHLALIGNALPRKCGLATFTSHVADALRLRYPAMRLDHYAMDDGSGVAYPHDITTIDASSRAAYRDAAAEIERSGADAIWLQHEYGIFGGEAGSHILELIEATRLPLIVSLHTILDEATPAQEEVMRRLLARAEHIVVMGEQGRKILRRRYGADMRRVSLIPHGVPDRPLRDPDELKGRFGWQGRQVLMTFGLLAPNKGIRHMIEAMPAVVEAHPDALYVIVGATHPNLVHHEGEAHRHALMSLACQLGVGEHIRFTDSFVEQEELLDMLQASDLYVTPYLNMGQVTSGTLSYAVAVGKPVIATPYIHAREILAEERGIIVPAADPAALAEAANALLSDDQRRLAMARAAHAHGRGMLWPSMVERTLLPLAERPQRKDRAKPAEARSMPVIPLDAIRRMSDSVGMLQHGILSVPDRDHGYCIDDNARALMVMALRGEGEEERRHEARYAAFVQHGWNPDTGRFRNFMGYDRRWLETTGSEDSNGRTLWALGVAAAQSPSAAIRDWARHLFDQTAPHLHDMPHTRSRAFAALGGYALLAARPGHARALNFLRSSSELLLRHHSAASRHDWNWFEPEMAYDNARLPEALIRAGQALDKPAMIDLGVGALKWLVGQQTGPRGTFRPIGCHGFSRPYAPPLAFDQQPLEAAATIDAAAAAFEATGDGYWRDVASHAFGWFFGDNDAGIPIAILDEGGCHDGLMATGINRNQGAESILSVHLAALRMKLTFGATVRAGQTRSTPSEARPFADAS